MNKIGSTPRFGAEIMGQLRDLQTSNKLSQGLEGDSKGPKTSFIDHLKGAIEEVNQTQVAADKKATDLATGKETNIHDTMLASSQAELSFNLMVQVRNKALEAYQEIMRMPV